MISCKSLRLRLRPIHKRVEDAFFFIFVCLIYLRKKWIRNLVWFFYILFLTYLLFIRLVVPSLTLFKLLLCPCFLIELPGAPWIVGSLPSARAFHPPLLSFSERTRPGMGQLGATGAE